MDELIFLIKICKLSYKLESTRSILIVLQTIILKRFLLVKINIIAFVEKAAS